MFVRHAPYTLHIPLRDYCFYFIRCSNINWARRMTCNICKAPKLKTQENRTGRSFILQYQLPYSFMYNVTGGIMLTQIFMLKKVRNYYLIYNATHKSLLS